jgi:hypothetical protein
MMTRMGNNRMGRIAFGGRIGRIVKVVCMMIKKKSFIFCICKKMKGFFFFAAAKKKVIFWLRKTTIYASLPVNIPPIHYLAYPAPKAILPILLNNLSLCSL